MVTATWQTQIVPENLLDIVCHLSSFFLVKKKYPNSNKTLTNQADFKLVGQIYSKSLATQEQVAINHLNILNLTNMMQCTNSEGTLYMTRKLLSQKQLNVKKGTPVCRCTT